jgi:hypothetical protein
LVPLWLHNLYKTVLGDVVLLYEIKITTLKNNNMKTLTFYTALAILFTSCASSYNEIGGLGMLTDKHIDPNGHYKMIAVSVGTSKKEIKSTKAESMQSAIDSTLGKVPGGLFLTNVKVYIVHGDYLAVSGDVWGQANEVMAESNTPTPQNIAIAGSH